MIDQNSQFFAILTAVGEAKQANATALGQPWTFSQMGVGDANGTDPIPNRNQTRLINEWRRASVNQVRTDPANPNIIITEQVIPADVGGRWIRELALYDADGDMVAVANCAPSFKPLLAQGTGKTQIIRMNFIVANTASVVLKIDPAIVLATRDYVDTQIIEALAKLDFKHSVLAATTSNIVLSGIQTIDGVLLPADARVLVKNQTQAKDNGIWVVPAGGAWKRAQDADSSIEVTPGLFVSVEKGTVNGDSVWQLVTDAPITLGTTALAFEAVAGRTGVSAGSYTRVTVDKLGRVIAGTNPTTLQDAGITDALRVGPGVVSSQRPVLAGGLPAGADNNADGAGGAISIREVGEVGTTKTDLDWAPGIHFHWFNRFARYLKMSAVGDLIWGGKKVWTEWNFDPASKANKTEVDTALAAKANKATTLAGYEIGDAFTKAQANAAIAAAIAGLVNSAPGALDTLKELSDALGGDPNFATTVLNKLALKADTLTSLRVGGVSRQRPVLSGAVAAGGDGGVDGMGGAIELREVNEVAGAQSDLKWAPAILFHWSGKFSRYLKMSTLGDLIWGDKKVWTEGNFTPSLKADQTALETGLAAKANTADVLATAYMMPNGRLMVPTTNGTLYIQWYEGPQADAETVNYPVVSHPVPFPIQCLWAGVFTKSTTSNQMSDQMFQVEYWGREGVKVFPQWFGTGGQGLVKPLIIAIGR